MDTTLDFELFLDWNNIKTNNYLTCATIHSCVFKLNAHSATKWDWHYLCRRYARMNYYMRGSIGMYLTVFAAVYNNTLFARHLTPLSMSRLICNEKRANLIRCRHVLMALLSKSSPTPFLALQPWILAQIIDRSLFGSTDGYDEERLPFRVHAFQTLANYACETRYRESMGLPRENNLMIPLEVLEQTETQWGLLKKSARKRLRDDETVGAEEGLGRDEDGEEN